MKKNSISTAVSQKGETDRSSCVELISYASQHPKKIKKKSITLKNDGKLQKPKVKRTMDETSRAKRCGLCKHCQKPHWKQRCLLFYVKNTRANEKHNSDTKNTNANELSEETFNILDSCHILGNFGASNKLRDEILLPPHNNVPTMIQSNKMTKTVKRRKKKDSEAIKKRSKKRKISRAHDIGRKGTSTAQILNHAIRSGMFGPAGRAPAQLNNHGYPPICSRSMQMTMTANNGGGGHRYFVRQHQQNMQQSLTHVQVQEGLQQHFISVPQNLHPHQRLPQHQHQQQQQQQHHTAQVLHPPVHMPHYAATMDRKIMHQQQYHQHLQQQQYACQAAQQLSPQIPQQYFPQTPQHFTAQPQPQQTHAQQLQTPRVPQTVMAQSPQPFHQTCGAVPGHIQTPSASVLQCPKEQPTSHPPSSLVPTK
eukprot:CAMPEP_0170168420 /NCGR_PEP_ID=MMETSP0040_2-20121228/1469_1 /TAXON_ID=641309 /ORGANISM="Lotharella oceanica, Strain CCMP622" /LENGTH=422 /DNA_ID=CAMNT_0010406669 /DNA_START=98 /DNA_END=1366 /DNA_ORIENTATION=+